MYPILSGRRTTLRTGATYARRLRLAAFSYLQVLWFQTSQGPVTVTGGAVPITAPSFSPRPNAVPCDVAAELTLCAVTATTSPRARPIPMRAFMKLSPSHQEGSRK